MQNYGPFFILNEKNNLYTEIVTKITLKLAIWSPLHTQVYNFIESIYKPAR